MPRGADNIKVGCEHKALILFLNVERGIYGYLILKRIFFFNLNINNAFPTAIFFFL